MISLLGMSLVLVNKKYCGKTIENTIEIQKAHNNKPIVFRDHSACRAYKIFIGNQHLDTK
ncbi:hypothetical protein RTB9991CWPP_00390 [Rickettsia typhi str. B9991CWPP]|uniref:Uncharacterized protein n=1 Tax=Rickettsia typhi str. TH1527 TaxID=1003201 RepID=A0ABM5MTA7_RICTP|nr:hypothetical protein RTTH1527_00390 [Rickettsia typhi str. TH1527]AFE54783.1 hypothetical protein RTB9991CWPP_00390 [Rickettsia typhi str. B9991CWPP]